MNENDFRRNKTTTIYERDQTLIDETTGEILHKEHEIKKKISSEPDFIKLYYNAMIAVNGISGIPLTFLLGLSAQIGFANGEKIIFFNNKTTRRAIAEYCDIGDNMVAKYIKRAVECGVLFITNDRGTYEVNPWLIAKGRWEHIKELQASFEFINGRWERTIREEKEETV